MVPTLFGGIVLLIDVRLLLELKKKRDAKKVHKLIVRNLLMVDM